MKKLYILLLFISVSTVVKVNAQALYINNAQTANRFNPGLGSASTPLILFDDIQIDNTVLGDADSIGFTKIKVGIRRIASAPAVTVNVYLSGFNPASVGLDSVPVIPSTLIGTFNLAANGATSQTQILSIGDSVNVFRSLARDTSNLFGGLQTAFIGVSFSNADPNNGWRMTTGPDGNFNAAWFYDADSTQPQSVFNFDDGDPFTTDPLATFYVETYGRPVYAPLAFDAKAVAVLAPENISCLTGPQTIVVQVQNLGLSPIPAGQAAVTLTVSGANTYSSTLANAIAIPVNAIQDIAFTNVNLSNAGVNLDTATVAYASDLRNTNDIATSGSLTASTISTYPALEDVEGTLPLLSFAETIVGDQLWTIHSEDTAYINPDTPDSLFANSGNSFFYFDSYSPPNSEGVQSRLFSNCITLGANPQVGTCTSSLLFFMSHDTTFIQQGWDDSLYVSVSTDKGFTWNRIGTGFGRLDPFFQVPGWRQEIVDLSAYNGQTIQIAFEGVSVWGSIIALDDISIESNCVVPVSLVSFTVAKQNKANKLTWKTSQEVNSLKYVVQQSKDGRNFVDLGDVVAAGTSSTERTYSFAHNLPSKGYNYYRIKMIDKDNKSKLSPVRSVLNLGLNEISVAPNPVANTMKLSINADKADAAVVVITDMSGKTVLSNTFSVVAGDNIVPVNTAKLNAGSYIIKVQLNGDVQMGKFIKL